MILWLKVLHILSVISWMVGLLYLPRLMVYHADTQPGTETSETFKVMERRLYKAIMTPAMMASWIFGLWLSIEIYAWKEGWFHAKLFLVLILSFMHMANGKWIREFAEDKRVRSTRFFRIANEIPTLLMIFIVIAVVVKPF